MLVTELLKKKRIYFDGAMGSLLQERGLLPGQLPETWNLTHKRDMIDIHLSYLNAGANIICSNTFGANRLKFSNLKEIITAGISNAKEAISQFSGKRDECFVAFDIGPIGKMLEPLGDLPFEEAVSIFSDGVKIADSCGVDLFIIETMNDTLETKAAVLACKENSDKPIFVTNAYDENRRLMTGANVGAVVAMLEGLKVDAIGVNCSLGPFQMLDIVKEYAKWSSLPIIVNPNAGMPKRVDGKTVYDVSADEFSDCMKEIASLGATILGGCCGTTPEYIQKTVLKTSNLPFSLPKKKDFTVISSYTHEVQITGKRPVLIGERINPTGKKRFKQALRENDVDYIVSEAISQQEKGVTVLDVNVGLPEIDETKMIKTVIREIQAVCDLPLQIDTVKKSAMEAALRCYNGKPLINSVNAKEESLNEVLPLCAKYGGTLIALTIDEDGIPQTAEGRLKLASKIVNRAEKFGISKRDIIVDPLAMTISSDDKSARVTLDSIKLIKSNLGVKTSLGVSNISFGLPNRDDINAVFLAMAFEAGLDLAIMNPFSTKMMKSFFCFNALNGTDKGCANYIDFATNLPAEEQKSTPVMQEKRADDSGLSPLCRAILKGTKSAAFKSAEELISDGTGAMIVINEYIIPALNLVGDRFEKKTMFLPQLLMSAEAAGMAFEAVKKSISSDAPKKEKIIIATVKGDIHEIGKNIVKVLLANYGYDVIDLGKDVSPEAVLLSAKENNVRLVCLSALMTTTVEAMEDTIKLLKKELDDVTVVVGGAVLTAEYAEMINADFYAKDAMETVKFAERFFNHT